MCGIIGYVGRREAAPILLHGLGRLEYRGYDSVGLAVHGATGLEVRKLAGRLQGLTELLGRDPVCGTSGVAHTRWATHGAPTGVNAHPHVDCSGGLAVVHNGIIENADVLRTSLERAGHRFATDTDTEVLAHLIEEEPAERLEQRVAAALARVEGSYGIAVVSAAEPGKIVVARHGSPVLLGIGEGECFVASDAAALLEHTRSVVFLGEGDIAVLTPDRYEIFDREAAPRVRAVDRLDWDLEAIELGGYAHFMLKEIAEQPETVRATVRGRLLPDAGSARLNGLNLDRAASGAIQRIVVVACGTSWHAGLVGRFIVEELAGIPVEVEYASEYRHRRRLPVPGVLTIAISQSGETADTLEALRAARAAGSRSIGIVNVVGSSIAREAQGGIYLHAGPEIGVASTKAFTSQIVALSLLGLYLGRQRGTLSVEQGRDVVRALEALPEAVERALALEPAVRRLAERYVERRNVLYLGRGVSFPVALEGALKLKEISYLHAEGYPAGEMKHGPIALIEPGMPVVLVAPRDGVFRKALSNLQEVKARGGEVILVTSDGGADDAPAVAHALSVPATPDWLSPVVTVIPQQLLAYHIAVLRGCDVDRPRNLAKSVTVE